VTTVEQDAGRAAVARANVARCGYADIVQVVHGDGFTFLDGVGAAFDFIFLDMVSTLERLDQVDRLFARCVARLAPGGALVSDNALHAGQVAADRVPEGALRYARYNQLALGHPELETVILPVRDGLALSRRRGIPSR
jgi:predicted O-methyltransferase YrrM